MIANRYPRTLRPRPAARWFLALLLVVLAVVAAGCAHEVPAAAPNFVFNPAAPTSPPDRPELMLADDDRILILAPHPDDEVLATGGLVQQAIAKGLPVEVVFLTNGDNNEFAFLFFSKAFTLDAHSAVYAGQTRAFEALRAGRELGLKGCEETFLGYPDFGTLEIWQNRWGDQRGVSEHVLRAEPGALLVRPDPGRAVQGRIDPERPERGGCGFQAHEGVCHAPGRHQPGPCRVRPIPPHGAVGPGR